MKTKYLHNKKFVIVSILSVLLVIVVIAGIYLAKFSYAQGAANTSGNNGMMGNGGNSGMMGGNGGMMNGMMGMGNMMTGKMATNMGHGMFPQYKGVKTGPALFHYEGCIMCHTINGLGGGMMGPDLSHIGSIRSFSWIATQIADPSAHFKRNSVVTLSGVRYRAVMPSFKNMSSKNIGILAKYLSSLKK